MIRGVLIIVGLLVGGGIAVIDQASLGHLRTYAPGLEPVWAQKIDARATLSRGATDGQYLGGQPVALNWRLVGLGTKGPQYAMRFVGDTGLVATARGTLVGTGFQIDDFQGQTEIEQLLPGLGTHGIAGRVAALKLSGGFVPGQGAYDVTGGGRFTGLALWGQEFGLGDVIVYSDGATWTVEISGDGAAIAYQARIVGRYGDPTAQATLVVTRTDELPPGLTQRLDRLLTPTAAGWEYDGPVDLATWIGRDNP